MNTIRRSIFTAFAAAAVLILAMTPAGAATNLDQLQQKLESLSATLEAQQKLLKQQNEEIQRLKQALDKQDQTTKQNTDEIAKVAAQAGKPSPVDSIKDLLGDKFSFSTDLRLRYEGLYNRDSGGTDLDDRNRFRIRWRVFGGYKVTDELSLHSMLTTSSGSWFEDGSSSRDWQPGRTSNQTMDDEFNNKDVFIGRIYATYKPLWLPGLEVTAGKFKNTFLHTDIMWDPDVNPEGIYEKYQYDGWGLVKPFFQFGQMAVSENNKTDDAYLLLWQAGATFKLPMGVNWTLAGSYYDWENLAQSDMSRIEGSSAGNSVGADGNYLYEYKLAEAITFVKLKPYGLPLMLWFDYIVNTASDVPDGDDTAWSTGFMLGEAKKKGDWALYFKYAEIDPDALVGAVTDGDFYGTNRKGYKVQGRYQLYDPWQLRLSWFQTDTKEGPTNSEDRLQLDMIFMFSL